MHRHKMKYIFWGLSISLTCISMHAGYQFYSSLFGRIVAILTTVTFETLRLSALYGLLNMSFLKRILSWGLYLVTAAVCASVAVTYFHATVVEEYEKAIAQTKERQKVEISDIKKIQARRIEDEINKINKDIEWCNIKLAKNPSSGYWNRKLDQFNEKKERTEVMRDSILAVIPVNNIENWIEKESLKLGIGRLDTDESHGKAYYLSNALGDLLGISGMLSKKIIALIIVIGVEFAIIMLAILNENQTQKWNMKNNDKLKGLIKKIGENDFYSFIESILNFITSHGRLLNASELSKKNRDIRKILIQNGVYPHFLQTLLLNN